MNIFKVHLKLIVIGIILSGPVAADLSGDWEGVLEVNGAKIPLLIHLMQKAGKPSGTLDSPAQGASDIPMSAVAYDDKKLMFEIAELGVHYEGSLDQTTGTIQGDFIQGGVFKLSFSPVKADMMVLADSSDIKDLLGQWGGTVEIPGNPLSLILHVKMEKEQLVATADSPDQGATGMAVDSIMIESGQVIFTMEALGVEFKGGMSENKQIIKGDFKQQGMVFKLMLSKDAQPQQVYERLQEPKPPFSYYIEDVEINNPSADITLAGTLTRPEDLSKVKAAAVMITGSGPQDRDETIFKHKPFWVIADYLAQQGYAVLRLDDRGVGGSTGDFNQATSADFVTDISAAVDFLQRRKDLPTDKVGLIGHSEGGMIAPMLAAERDDLSFLIRLAGPGIPIAELLAEQKFLIAKAMGQDVEALEKQRVNDLVFHQNMIDWSTSEDYSNKVSAYLTASLKNQTTNEKQLKMAIESNLKLYDTPWFKYFIAFEPAEYLAQIKTPVLALNGENDLQVAAVSNLNGIKQALSQAGHSDITIKKLPQLNHLFQTSDTGSTTEYGMLTETFAPIALQAMSDWLDQRFK